MSNKFAGFWIRLVAHIIDSLVLTVASTAPEYLIAKIFGINLEMSNAFLLQILNVGLYFCCAFPYYTWGHYRYGTTLGKRPFRIYVVNYKDQAPITVGQSIIRTLAYALSYLPFCTGYLMAAFHPEKRGLHDLVAGTVSVCKSQSFSPTKYVTEVESGTEAV